MTKSISKFKKQILEAKRVGISMEAKLVGTPKMDGQKVYIKTFGCTANISDSEVMAGLLHDAGYRIIDSPESADIIITNVCTVKGEEKALRELHALRAIEKNNAIRIVIAGCVTSELRNYIAEIIPAAVIVDTQNVSRIVELLEKRSITEISGIINSKKIPKIGYPKIRKRNLVAIVPILSGCVGECSYCSVRMIKGKLYSYPEELILKEVRNAIDFGCKEIWITSQDNACYGLDMQSVPTEIKNNNLATLLEKICQIKGDFMVRVGMMNPEGTATISDDLIKVYENYPKMFQFAHIPVQAGSNRILTLMKRKYTCAEFVRLVQKFRKKLPDMTLSTDIICGFPTETESDFQKTLDLLKKTRPDIVNISRFQPRKGTLAADMHYDKYDKSYKRISTNEMKRRSKLLTELAGSIALENNKRWIGWKGRVLIDEKGKEGTSTVMGRNFAYKPIVLPCNNTKCDKLIGSFETIKICEVKPCYLIGKQV